MTIDPSTRDPDTAPIPKFRPHERRRAAIWLAGLVVVAVVLVAIMLAVLGTSGGSNAPTPVANPTGPPVVVSSTPTSSTPKSTPVSTPSTTPTTKTSTSSGPSNRRVSCPTSAPCALPDDIGDFVGALNSLRASKHLAPVTGRITQGAQTCAVTEASNCPSGFFWEPVGRSGTEMIQKIFTKDRGSERLLDPALRSIELAWAYIPSSKSFECAVVVGR